MNAYAFVSHSSHDNEFVERLAEELKTEGVWVAVWDMDLGDPLPTKIEHAIERASEFIIILSRRALESRWVKYESHMAVIRSLEDENFRIVVVRIDDCMVPLRFKPFLYVDCPNDPYSAIPKLKDFIQKRRVTAEEEILYRRHFVDRTDELGQIEQQVADPEVRIVCLNGFFGIGKTMLVKESALRLWQRPQIAMISLTPAHIGSRLSLELCAAAAIGLPADGATSEELTRASLLAVETLVSRGRVIVFNQFESVLDEDGAPPREILNILLHLSEIAACSKVPVFVLSRRWPRLSPIPRARIGDVKVAGMETEHLVTILESEASRIQRKQYSDSEALRDLAAQLYGYPLGGRLAAPLLVKYSPDYLLAHLQHIASLMTDIAEAILAHSAFGDGATQILEVLALFDGALTAEQLAGILQRSSDSVLGDIDILADHSVVELDGIAVRLHPLISDFYFKQVRSGPNFKDYAKRLAGFSKASLQASTIGTADYVHWLTHASRLLLLSGDLEGGRSLRRDLLGELRVACIELYQRQEYDLSLRYCEEYLQSDPADFDVRFHKARCLSRLERPTEAHKILDELLAVAGSTPRRRARLNYAKGRTFLEQGRIQEAKDYFLNALGLSPDYLAALQGISEVLLRMNMIDDAAGFLKRALTVSPMDSFALSSYSEALWRQGKREEAIKMIGLAVKAQPKNASFLFRSGRFYQDMGSTQEAYEYFRKAKESDDTYSDAGLSFASVAIDLSRFAEAKAEIDALRPKLSGEKRWVLQGIEVEYELAMGNVDKAYQLATAKLKRGRDVPTLGLMAKIEMALFTRSRHEGMQVMAESHRQRAFELVVEGLQIEPSNPQLLAHKETIDGR